MSITSANSTLTLAVVGLFPAPQAMKGYAADDAFATEAADMAEAVMGVDGQLSAGFTPWPTALNLAFQADSPSIEFFDALISAQKVLKDVYVIQGTLALPGIGKSFTLTKGYLTKGTQFPTGKKTLQPMMYTITFESTTPALL